MLGYLAQRTSLRCRLAPIQCIHCRSIKSNPVFSLKIGPVEKFDTGTSVRGRSERQEKMFWSGDETPLSSISFPTFDLLLNVFDFSVFRFINGFLRRDLQDGNASRTRKLPDYARRPSHDCHRKENGPSSDAFLK
ncbi:unnamed protein product [Phaeothamnion confervicola]